MVLNITIIIIGVALFATSSMSMQARIAFQKWLLNINHSEKELQFGAWAFRLVGIIFIVYGLIALVKT